jgi:hypothetical protein
MYTTYKQIQELKTVRNTKSKVFSYDIFTLTDTDKTLEAFTISSDIQAFLYHDKDFLSLFLSEDKVSKVLSGLAGVFLNMPLFTDVFIQCPEETLPKLTVVLTYNGENYSHTFEQFVD